MPRWAVARIRATVKKQSRPVKGCGEAPVIPAMAVCRCGLGSIELAGLA